MRRESGSARLLPAAYAYAMMQVLDSDHGDKGLDQAKLAEYIHNNTFDTYVGQGRIRQERRMGRASRDDDPVPRHHRQRRRAIQETRVSPLSPNEYETGN